MHKQEGLSLNLQHLCTNGHGHVCLVSLVLAASGFQVPSDQQPREVVQFGERLNLKDRRRHVMSASDFHMLIHGHRYPTHMYTAYTPLRVTHLFNIN